MHRSRRPAGFSRPDLHDWLVDHDPLVLVADRNDVLETLGHDPRSLAAESTWLHRLGPSAMCAHRRLVTLLEAVGDGHAVPLKALASELGLPSGEGRNAKVVKTLARLVDYGIATPRNGVLAISLALPPARRVAPCLEEAVTTPSTAVNGRASGLRPEARPATETTPEVTL